MSNTPSGAARREFANGWTTVLASALGVGVGTMGLGFYALGFFVKPLQAEFGWSRAEVSGAATFQQLGIFLSAPIVGRLADRIGVRPIALASYIAMPLALVALSHVGPSVAAWYGLWLLVSLAGCGTTPAVWARAVSVKFDAARGTALGLMLVGTGLAALLTPILLGPVFAHSGWRTAALTMAVVAAAIGLPVSLWMRGDRARAIPHAGGTAAELEADTTQPRGAFEFNRATGIMLVIALLLGFIVAGLVVHLVPMLADRGMAPARAAGMAAAVGLAVVVARVLVGWLFDRFHAPFVACAFLTLPIVSCLLLRWGGPVLPAALGLGLAAGAEVDMLAFFTSRYAALRNYGATYGVILATFCLGAATGPLAFARSVDVTGAYDLALTLSAVGLAAVVVLIACLGPYRRTAAE